MIRAPHLFRTVTLAAHTRRPTQTRAKTKGSLSCKSKSGKEEGSFVILLTHLQTLVFPDLSSIGEGKQREALVDGAQTLARGQRRDVQESLGVEP